MKFDEVARLMIPVMVLSGITTGLLFIFAGENEFLRGYVSLFDWMGVAGLVVAGSPPVLVLFSMWLRWRVVRSVRRFEGQTTRP